MKFETNTLKALIEMAAKQDVRYYLNGILIESDSRAMVATDGVALMATWSDPDKLDDQGADADGLAIGEHVMLPRDIAVSAVKLAGKNPHMELTKRDGKYYLDNLQFTPIEGRYPDWRRIIPGSTIFDADHAPGQFNPDYLSTIKKAYRLMEGKGPKTASDIAIFHNGPTDPAFVTSAGTSGSDAFCVLMPMRLGDALKPFKPGAFTEPVTVKEKSVQAA